MQTNVPLLQRSQGSCYQGRLFPMRGISENQLSVHKWEPWEQKGLPKTQKQAHALHILAKAHNLHEHML